MKKNIFILSIFLLITSCNKKPKQTEAMMLNLPKGYQQTLVYQMDASYNENEEILETNQVNYILDSIDKNDGYHFTAKIIKMATSTNTMGQHVSFDSDTPSSMTFLDDDLKKYIKKEFTFITDKYGFLTKGPKFKDGTETDMAVLESFHFSPFTFPREALYEGFKWDDTTTNPILKSQQVKTTYVVDSIGKKEIFISSMGKINGIENYTSDSSLRSNFRFDRKTKALISAEKELVFSDGIGKANFKIFRKTF